MKKIRRYTLITVMVTILLMTFTGCGNKKERQINENENSGYIYTAEYKYFNTESYMPYASVFAADGSLYFAGFTDNTSHFFRLSPEEKEPLEIPLALEENTWINSITREGDRGLLLACSRYDEELQKLILMRLSLEGEILETIDTLDRFLNIPNFEVENLARDKEGNYYITSGKSLYILEPENNLSIYELKAELLIKSLIYLEEDDRLLILYSDKTLGEVNRRGRKLQPVNTKISFGYGTYTAGREKDLLYSSEGGLYVCNIEDEKPEMLVNWADNNLDKTNIQSFMVLEDGRIAALSVLSASFGSENEIALLTKTDAAELQEKTALTYGYACLNSVTNSAIVKFNKTNPKYRIELKSYGDETMTPDEKKLMLQKDIIAGKGPDIFDIGLFFSEEERYELIEMGILEDLNPYFEKDSVIKRADYREDVLQVYGEQDKLYAVMPVFSLGFLAGRVSDLGEENAWTLEEMLAFIDKQPEDIRILPNAGKTDMLNMFCELNINRFINMETGECSFNNAEFKSLLEAASRFPAEAEKKGILNDIEDVRNGKLLLMRGSLMNVGDFQKFNFIFGEPVNFIGYPSSTGKGALAGACTSVMAISRSSENKEGAWEFIRFILNEQQQENYAAEGLPIKISVLDRLFERQMKPEYIKDANGNLKEKPKGGWGLGSPADEVTFSVDYYASTEEETARAKELLDSIGNSMGNVNNRQVYKIIEEEAAAFFNGHKSIDETVDIIQSRVQNYVNEKR